MDKQNLVEAHARTLAVAKLLKEAVAAREKESKAALMELLGEGAKTTAAIEGRPIATISTTRAGADTYALEDADAYLAWCADNAFPAPTRTVATLTLTNPDLLLKILADAGVALADVGLWSETETLIDMPDTQTLEEQAAAANEVPDGVRLRKGRAASVSVRQSAPQVANLLAAFPAARVAAEAVTGALPANA